MSMTPAQIQRALRVREKIRDMATAKAESLKVTDVRFGRLVLRLVDTASLESYAMEDAKLADLDKDASS